MLARARLNQLTKNLKIPSRHLKTMTPPNSSNQSRSTTIHDDTTNNDIKISIPQSLTETLTVSKIQSFPPFKTWLSTLQKSLSAQHSNPSHPFHSTAYTLKSIEIQTADFFGGERLGFLKFKADVSNEQGETIPGSVFMRGGSVAMLIVLRPDDADLQDSDSDSDDEYAILTLQPRIPAGSLSFVELPAGMIDDSGTFGGAAAKEIREETGLEIHEDELLDMTSLALSTRESDFASDEPHLQDAVYPSPGGCDEFIPIFLVRKTMRRDEIDGLKGKLTGLRESGEKITLRVVRVRDVWRVGARDGKTLAAMALYEGLKREGRV